MNIKEWSVKTFYKTKVVDNVILNKNDYFKIQIGPAVPQLSTRNW